MSSDKIALSVVIVSDFEPSRQKSWRNEITLLRALAKQDLSQPFEVIVVENQAHQVDVVPAELSETIQNTRL